MKKIFYLIFILLFSCSNAKLIKEGVTESEFVRDREICEGKAYEIVGKAPPLNDKIGITSWRRALDDQYYECMSKKGYTRQ